MSGKYAYSISLSRRCVRYVRVQYLILSLPGAVCPVCTRAVSRFVAARGSLSGIIARDSVSGMCTRSIAVRGSESGMLESRSHFIAARGSSSGMHTRRITARDHFRRPLNDRYLMSPRRRSSCAQMKQPWEALRPSFRTLTASQFARLRCSVMRGHSVRLIKMHAEILTRPPGMMTFGRW